MSEISKDVQIKDEAGEHLEEDAYKTEGKVLQSGDTPPIKINMKTFLLNFFL
jgi:hypothetical protein